MLETKFKTLKTSQNYISELLNITRVYSYQNTSGIFTYNKVPRSFSVINTPAVGESVRSNDHRNIIIRLLDPIQQFTQAPWHHLHQKAEVSLGNANIAIFVRK